MLATQAWHLTFHPGTHVDMQGETQLYKLVLWSTQHTVVRTLVCMHCAHTQMPHPEWPQGLTGEEIYGGHFLHTLPTSAPGAEEGFATDPSDLPSGSTLPLRVLQLGLKHWFLDMAVSIATAFIHSGLHSFRAFSAFPHTNDDMTRNQSKQSQT